MELQAGKEGWYLALQDGFVQLIQIDFRLGLFLSDASGKARLYIETPLRLNDSTRENTLTPAEPSSLAPALPLFNAKVEGVTIHKEGQLKVQFGNSRVLEVEPDETYEAWQLGCSIGFMMVCSPGGHVLFFEESESRSTPI